MLTAVNSEINETRGSHCLESPADCSQSRWYATYTNPRHEKSVALQMLGHRIECFLPTYKSVRRWKDRRKQLDLPLFPGYVFVHIPLADRLRVLQTPGVVHLVSFSGKPAVVPDGDIEALRSFAQKPGVQPHPYLKVGKRVRVHGGPMVGLEGVLVRRKDNLRVVLSIHLIQRSVAVEVDEAEVEPLC